jgi:hypothetical protein
MCAGSSGLVRRRVDAGAAPQPSVGSLKHGERRRLSASAGHHAVAPFKAPSALGQYREISLQTEDIIATPRRWSGTGAARSI